MKSYLQGFYIPAVFLRGFGLGWLTMAIVWEYLPLTALSSLMSDMWLIRLSTVGQ